MKKLFLLLMPFIAVACTGQPYEFSTESTRDIISYLASDEMNGRQAFTEDADRAADYISSHFKDIGLEPAPGESGFLQEFNLFELTIENVELSVNGAVIDDEVIMGLPDEEEYSTVDISTVRYIGPEDNFRTAFGQARSEGQGIVLVDTTHADIYSRYRQFFSRPGRKLQLGQEGSMIFALYSGPEATEVSASMSASLSKPVLINVVGMIPGKNSEEYVLFSAHYDHIGIRSAVEGDSIANGANDDASGTTAVIELARYFKTRPQPERSLLFVAFTAEESGGYGSRYFSEQLDPDKIMAMFNIEMIGKPAVEGPNTAWITGWERSDLGEMMAKSAEGSAYTFYPDPYPDQNLFYRSDNATLARLGVPAHSISTTPIDVDPDYHQVSDEVETLDLDHLTNTIRAIAVGAQAIVDGNMTPKRVDTDNID